MADTYFDLIKNAIKQVKAPKKPTEINDDADLAKTVSSYNDVMLEMETMNTALNAEIAVLIEKYFPTARQKALESEDYQARISQYCLANRERLLKLAPTEEGKSIDMGQGVIQFRKNPDRIGFGTNEEDAIGELRAKGFGDTCVQITAAVNKNVVKAMWEKLVQAGVSGLKRAEGKEVIAIKLKRQNLG